MLLGKAVVKDYSLNSEKSHIWWGLDVDSTLEIDLVEKSLVQDLFIPISYF